MSTLERLLTMGRTMRLLYVEDDEALQHELALLLSDIFASLTLASDGEEGLEKFSKESFDLVITDIRMPKMNGIEMIRAIRKQNPAQPVVVISAHNEIEYLLELIDLGVDGFITKPLSGDHIFHTLIKSVGHIYEAQELKRHQEELENLNVMLEDEVSRKTKDLKKSYIKAHGYQQAFLKMGLVLLADANGVILEASDNALKLFGFYLEEMKGKKLENFFPPQTSQGEGFLDSFPQKEQWEGELLFQTKTMQLLTLHVSSCPVSSEDEETEFLILIQDYSTARMKFEKKREETQTCANVFICKHVVESLPLPAAILDKEGRTGLHNTAFVEMIEEGFEEGLMHRLKAKTLTLDEIINADDPFLRTPSLWQKKAQGFEIQGSYETVLGELGVRVHIKALDRNANAFLAVVCYQGAQDDAL